MILNKNSGDELAVNFQKLLKKHINKYASNNVENSAETPTMENSAETPTMENSAETPTMENSAGDMLVSSLDDAPSQESDLLDSMIVDDPTGPDNALVDSLENDLGDWENNIEDYVLDSKAEKIMRGLGKIAGSLKRKGEIFAADVVEATALSIKDDMIKEASVKKNKVASKQKILAELDNMASRLYSKGKKLAAREVIKTASKIARS